MTTPTQTLLYRQEHYLPRALEDLNNNNTKTLHWAWWAFPTGKGGDSELITGLAPYPDDPHPSIKSSVSPETAPFVMRGESSIIWRQTLEKICQLLGEHGGPDGYNTTAVIPPIDNGRIHHFLKFWTEIKDKPAWLEQVIKCLTRHFTLVILSFILPQLGGRRRKRRKTRRKTRRRRRRRSTKKHGRTRKKRRKRHRKRRRKTRRRTNN